LIGIPPGVLIHVAIGLVGPSILGVFRTRISIYIHPLIVRGVDIDREVTAVGRIRLSITDHISHVGTPIFGHRSNRLGQLGVTKEVAPCDGQACEQ